MKETGICVGCDLQKAKSLVENSFKGKGFKVEYKGNSGVAEKGSKMMRMFFGALVDYHKLEFEVTKKKDESIITVKKKSSGISGGVIGASKAEKMYNTVVQDLITEFKGAGITVRKE